MQRKINFILIFILAVAFTANAQSWKWTANKGQKEENAHYIDYDNAGNVYSYHTDLTLRKFDPSGNLLWSYVYPITASFPYTDFAVERSTGNVFLFDGAGSRMMKLGTNGVPIAVLPYNSNTIEIWHADFNCNEVLVAHGGGYAAKSNQYIVVANDLSSYTGFSYSPTTPDHDIVIATVDNDYSYQVFAATSVEFGEPQLANVLYKSPLSPVGLPVWSRQTDFNFFEGNIYQYRGYTSQSDKSSATVGYNGMAQTANYLYLYDGVTLEKYDKDGNYLDSVVVGDNRYSYAGLDVDCKCTAVDGKVYAGANNQVKVYNSNCSLFTTYTFQDSIYGVAVGNGHLYVAGNHFVESRSIGEPTCSDALPIQLISLYAEGDVIYWQTASEVNNDHFTIYKTDIDLSEKLLGTVKGAGNCSTRNRYDFITPGDGRYALKQIDYDGAEVPIGLVFISGGVAIVVKSRRYGNSNVLGQILFK